MAYDAHTISAGKAGEEEKQYSRLLTAKGRLKHVEICRELLSITPVRYIGGRFYDRTGPVEEGTLEEMFLYILLPLVETGFPRHIRELMDTLRVLTRWDAGLPEQKAIHFQNGTMAFFGSQGSFSEEEDIVVNRLPICYNPEAEVPETWLRFLHSLLYPEDIVTLQEYMGYLLLPTNAAQRMLLIIGRGGEGKSRIGVVLQAILGNTMNQGSIRKLVTNQFARADQEGKLLFLDDDLTMNAITDTDILKTIVTLDGRMDVERKGKQSYQANLFVRLMAFGNGSLSSLYDKSEGFFRRQIILTTREKDPGRRDDAYLGEKLVAEKEGILLWMLEGLKRLLANDFHFTISDRARESQQEMRANANNIDAFLQSDGYIAYEDGTSVSSRLLYDAYVDWCMDNLEHPLSERTFTAYLKGEAARFGLTFSKNVPTMGNRRVRGYQGIHLTRLPGNGWS